MNFIIAELDFNMNDIGMVICLENIKNNDIGNLISLLGMVIYSNY